MSRLHFPTHGLLALTLAAAAATTLRAQVPDSAAVVALAEHSWSPPLDLGGLAVVDFDAGPMATYELVQGLPPGITGVTGAPRTGARSVGILPNGKLLVGEADAAGEAVEVYEVTLQGFRVDSLRTAIVGRASAGSTGWIRSVHPLADGDAIVVGLNLDASGPVGETAIGRWSHATNTVSAVPITGVVGKVVDAAVSLDSETIYVVLDDGTLTVHSVPVTGGALAFLTTSQLMLGSINDIAVDAHGTIVLMDGIFFFEYVDPVTGSSSTTLTGRGYAITYDFAANQLITVYNDGTNNVTRAGAGGTSSSGVRVFQGYTRDVAVQQNPRPYGRDTPGASTYAWVLGPNAGGRPRVGNSAFELQLEASGGDASGCLLIGGAEASFSLLGVGILVQPEAEVPFPPSGNIRVPIPPSALIGRTLFLQTLHLDGGAPAGVAASNGYRVTFVP